MKRFPMGYFRVDESGSLVLPESGERNLSFRPGEKIYYEIGENGVYLHRPVSELARVYIEPTNMCNLSCATCIRHSWSEPDVHMEYRLFEKILSAVEGFREPPTVFFGGFGEPLFHPEIVRMVRGSKNKGCRVELITNGVLLKEETQHALFDAGLDFLWVSIDGATPETYADVRLGNELPNILDNLHSLRLRSHRFSSKPPHLGISFVLMKRNLHDFSKVVELSQRLGARKIMVTNVLPYSKEMKEEILYTRSMSRFDNRFRSIDLPRIDLNGETVKEVSEVLRRFELPDIASTQFSPPFDTCPFVERGSVSVRSDGKVSPCLSLMHDHTSYLGETERKIQSYFVGDIGNKNLLDIWNDPEYRKLRERLFQFDFSPCTVCNSCEFPESNIEDCFGSAEPACGGCLWAQGFIQCP
jgi:MoaA/NifB/PqqE/SkfB family radical SAM enzyme